MPAASCRTRPARTISLWLMASASAGSSRSVGISDRVHRMGLRLVLLFDLVGALHARVVEQALDRHPVQDVRLEDLGQIALLDAAVPDILWIDHDHGTVTALREAARLVDADLDVATRGGHAGPEGLDELLDIALGGAGVALGTHEDVTLVLSHLEESDPFEVVVEGEHHEQHQEGEADLLRHLALAH